MNNRIFFNLFQKIKKISWACPKGRAIRYNSSPRATLYRVTSTSSAAVGFPLLSLTHRGLMVGSFGKATKILIPALLLILLCISCGQRNTDYLYDKKPDNSNKLIRANRYLVKSDSLAIMAYAKRRGWNMQVTNTGLWYQIVSKGKGEKAQKEMIASFAFSAELLDGTLCYSSNTLGLKTFRIGHGGVEAGLEQAALLLSQGDSARFILPPYLAYGLTGDGNKIGQRECLVYILSLRGLEVKKK